MKGKPRGPGLVLLLALVAGCGQDGDYWITIRLPLDLSAEVRDRIETIVVIAVVPGSEASCDALNQGTARPGDAGYVAEAEIGIGFPEGGDAQTLNGVGPGRRLIIAEARDAAGVALLRGCADVETGRGEADRVTVELRPLEAECETDDDCEDEFWCTVGERCDMGACLEGSARDCSAGGGSCVDGTCDEDQHACLGDPLPSGTACDDESDCTEDDSCDGDGLCVGTQVDCSHLDGPCSQGSCTEETGACAMMPLNEGGPCDDGEYCTVNDTCAASSCQGEPRTCPPPSNPCRNGVCDEQDDRCVLEWKPFDAPCDDGLFCTLDDRCDVGNDCVGTGTPCTTICQTRCDEANGVCEADLPLTPCDPGGSCVISARCGLSGECEVTEMDTYCEAGWARRRELTIDNPETDNFILFPLLVRLDASRIDYLAMLPDGSDLVFSDAFGMQIPHEIERWDPDGDSWIWVRVPLIQPGANRIFMYYDNPSITVVNDPTEVWMDDFRAVWHLDDDGRDATANANDGVSLNTVSAPGVIAGGQQFGGVDAAIEVDPGGLQVTGTALTIESWARVTAEPHDWLSVYGAGSGTDNGRCWQMYWDRAGSGWQGRLRVAGIDGVTNRLAGDLDQWVYLVLRYDGAAVHLFGDGVMAAERLLTGDLDPIATPFVIGNNPELSPREFAGIIDEVRISDVVRTDGWIRLQYLSMQDAIVTFGSEETF